VERIATGGAPAAIGPYSQGMAHGEFVFTAGQLGLDPATGRLVDGGAAAEFERAVANIAAILETAGSGLDHVLKLTLYLTDLADFEAVNQSAARLFKEPFPARATVQVCRLPKDARVEIDVIAARSS
jgi:2-iminobutanoate/2-iminopropanoate deaminase